MKTLLLGAAIATAVFLLTARREVRILRDCARLLYDEAAIG